MTFHSMRGKEDGEDITAFKPLVRGQCPPSWSGKVVKLSRSLAFRVFWLFAHPLLLILLGSLSSACSLLLPHRPPFCALDILGLWYWKHSWNLVNTFPSIGICLNGRKAFPDSCTPSDPVKLLYHINPFIFFIAFITVYNLLDNLCTSLYPLECKLGILLSCSWLLSKA